MSWSNVRLGQFGGAIAKSYPSGNLLYPLARTGPVVPAHSGHDQERMQAEREFLEDALGPALRAPAGAAFLS